MNKFHSSKTKTLKYSGAEAVNTTHLFTRNTSGERIVVLRWLGDSPSNNAKAGDLVMKHITGDAWKAPEKFVTHAERTIPNGTDADAEAFIAERLNA
jgi:hypothetical protein